MLILSQTADLLLGSLDSFVCVFVCVCVCVCVFVCVCVCLVYLYHSLSWNLTSRYVTSTSE